MTPVEFLTARYDEREAIARAAIGTAVFQTQTGRWSFEKVAVTDPYGHIPIVFALADGGGKTQVADLSAAWEANERGAHIAANDPRSVLDDIAAKRVVLKHLQQITCYEWSGSYAVREEARDAITALCQPFVSHSDYEDLRWAA